MDHLACNYSCVSLLLPRLPKLPSQCYSKGFATWAVWAAINKYSLISHLNIFQGTKYAATQAGMYCFCGDVYDRYAPYHACTTPCKGNTQETCGGSSALEVWQIGKFLYTPFKVIE